MDKKKEGQKKRPEKVTLHMGVKMRDLKGLQKSLVHIKSTLGVGLEDVGKDRS